MDDLRRIQPVSRLRIFDEARTAHLERLADMEPAGFVYRIRRYDFDDDLARSVGARQMGRLRTAVLLVRLRPSHVELNEPALIKAWPSLLLYAMVIRLSNLFGRRHTTIVAYAIENADVAGNLASYSRLPRRLASAVVRSVFRFVLPQGSRLAFGTQQAELEYLRIIPRLQQRTDTTLIPALSTACRFCELEHRPGRLTFLGSFEPRKGILELLEAWDTVVLNLPDATLRIVGKGPLLATVEEWARTRPSVNVTVDPPREEIHQALRESTAVVLYSQRAQRWREQVGLPILEGLSHGSTVVTSDETGIADWLRGRGHAVIPPADASDALALALVDVLSRPVPVARVLADLPTEDGRITADRWLFDA